MGIDNNYVECLVESKASPAVKILSFLSLALAIIFFLSSIFGITGIVGLILCIGAGAL